MDYNGDKVIGKDQVFDEITRVAPTVWIKDNFFSEELCDNIVNKMNICHMPPGRMGGGVNENYKKSNDIFMKENQDLFKNELDEIIPDLFGIARELISSKEFDCQSIPHNEFFDTNFEDYMMENFFFEIDGPKLQKYEKGGLYRNHSESGYYNLTASRRTLVYSVYLNDDFEGGFTHFPREGVAVQARKGRIVLFDSSWTNVHSGTEVYNGQKYFMTGWYLSNLRLSNNDLVTCSNMARQAGL